MVAVVGYAVVVVLLFLFLNEPDALAWNRVLRRKNPLVVVVAVVFVAAAVVVVVHVDVAVVVVVVVPVFVVIVVVLSFY